jgi:hypothetical protein
MVPPFIKRKMNQRKRLLRRNKIVNNHADLLLIKGLYKDIKRHYQSSKSNNIRRALKPGNPISFWDAEKIAKGTNISTRPKTM